MSTYIINHDQFTNADFGQQSYQDLRKTRLAAEF